MTTPTTLLPLDDVRLSPILLDPTRIDSVALRRLVEEVREEMRNDPPRAGSSSYDRIHNRHNRS